MFAFRSVLVPARPRLALGVVAAVGAATAAVLVPFGLLRIGVSGLVGRLAFLVVFGVVPALAGGICGRYRLGVPAAAASGVAPGVAFFLVVAVGAALEVGTFGGGDSPLGPFALALTAPSVALALLGFGLAVAIRTLLE